MGFPAAAIWTGLAIAAAIAVLAACAASLKTTGDRAGRLADRAVAGGGGGEMDDATISRRARGGGLRAYGPLTWAKVSPDTAVFFASPGAPEAALAADLTSGAVRRLLIGGALVEVAAGGAGGGSAAVAVDRDGNVAVRVAPASSFTVDPSADDAEGLPPVTLLSAAIGTLPGDDGAPGTYRRAFVISY